MTISTERRSASVVQWYAAFDVRDIEGLCAISHPEIEITPVDASLGRLPGASFHGHEGVRTLMDWSYERYPGVRVASTVTKDVPAGILAETTYFVDHANEPRSYYTGFAVFRLLEEQIYRIQAFANETEALKFSTALGALTPREREILQMLLDGMNSRQIADALVLSPATVRTHVQNAMGRLGARTRIDAISRALKHGELHL
jgi:DNA-binding CsgD family transcriptional regulator